MRGIETPFEVKNTPRSSRLRAAEEAGQGAVLGFSAHTDPAGVLDAAIDTGVYSMGMIAYHFLTTSGEPILEKAKKTDFGVMAMKSSRVIQNVQPQADAPERVKALTGWCPAT